MTSSPQTNLQQRVVQAAETVLKHNGSVGPLELFQQMGFLQPVHLEGWRKGDELYHVLEDWIQVGPEKFQKTIEYFEAWTRQRGLQRVVATYTRRSPKGIEELHITDGANPQWEQFYRTHYALGDLPAKKATQLTAKLSKVPELVVFEKVSEEGACSECGAELAKGDFLCMERKQPLCLSCADLDQLVFLPAGDTALTRRARKYSSLAAVVVRFSRARKRYERQGLLVTSAALAQAEQECAADAPARAAARAHAAADRQDEDREFVAALSQAILQRYPECPGAEARRIAQHTGLRSSGRVGRSAAGRALDSSAIDLAVTAHIRHEHTNYDVLLMSGVERQAARAQVRESIDRILAEWSRAS